MRIPPPTPENTGKLHCQKSPLWTYVYLMEQELSYHKQIAHQLRTQYVEGIYDNPVTLKSRLMVTQVTGKGTIE